MNKNEFINELKKLNIIITEEQFKKIDLYIKLLMEYNKHTNLTAIKDYESILLKHFFDSLMIEQYNYLNNAKTVLDIGTGAGFPGMVIAIMHEDITVTLLDSNNKKIKFLELLIKELNIKNVKLVNKRAEEYIETMRSKFDIVTSRAVSHLAILSEISIPFVKVGGYFIPLKGNIEEELELSKNIIQLLGGKINDVHHYHLIKEDATRNILVVQKETETSLKYPRNYSQIKKSVEKMIKIK